ncbi:hypothetical protein EDD15DRAFT_2530265 [Pisolithus albus]|nr:hypothetical protein EDD15DRAFT_2530265 [Pisolithus albus]
MSHRNEGEIIRTTTCGSVRRVPDVGEVFMTSTTSNERCLAPRVDLHSDSWRLNSAPTQQPQQDRKFAPNNFPMARTQSEKHNLLECAKPSNSTPNPTLNQLPGRSQARAGDFPSVQGTSGAASTERLATSLGCSFDGSLRDTPATITAEVADTGVVSGVEEHRENPLVPSRQGAIATSTDRGADQEEFRAAFPKLRSRPASQHLD